MPSILRVVLPALMVLAAGLAGPAPAAAALRVNSQGPRAGTVGGMLRAALIKAGVRNGRVEVRVRRARPAWVISVTVYKAGSRAAVLTQALRARRGRLTWQAANALARRAAAALRRGGGAARPEPPVKVVDPDAGSDGDDDGGGDDDADAGEDDAQTDAPAKPAAPAPAPAPAKPAPAPAPAAPAPAPAVKPDEAPASEDEDLGFEVGDAKRGEAKTTGARPAAHGAAAAAGAGAADAEGKDLGFEVGDGPKADGEAESPRIKARSKRRRDSDDDEDRVVVRVQAGLGLAWRRFLLDAQTTAFNYETGVFSQFFFRTELYPLHLITDSGIADVGVRFAYTHSAGLKSEITRDSGASTNPSTSVARVWGGLNWRLPRFASPSMPRFELRLGVAHMEFAIEDLEALDTSFTAMAAGGSVLVPIRRWIQVTLDAEYRMLVRSRAQALQTYLVKTASLQGFNLEGGLCGRIAGGLGYRATVTAERFLGDLPSLNGAAEMLVRDWYISVDAALTYEI